MHIKMAKLLITSILVTAFEAQDNRAVVSESYVSMAVTMIGTYLLSKALPF